MNFWADAIFVTLLALLVLIPVVGLIRGASEDDDEEEYSSRGERLRLLVRVRATASQNRR